MSPQEIAEHGLQTIRLMRRHCMALVAAHSGYTCYSLFSVTCFSCVDEFKLIDDAVQYTSLI